MDTVICIDFDGTCVAFDYPNIGKDIGAVPVLKWLTEEKGCKLILWTIRSGDMLYKAAEWFMNNDIPLYDINKNPDQKPCTESPKVFANVYVDDAALGCPLKLDTALSDHPFVDWNGVREWFEGYFEGKERKSL